MDLNKYNRGFTVSGKHPILKFITYSFVGIIGALLAFLMIIKIEEANYRAELYKKWLDKS